MIILTGTASAFGPHNTIVSPDGKTEYVATGGAGNVSVIDTATNEVTSTITLSGKEPYPWYRTTVMAVAIAPDGSKLYVLCNKQWGLVYVIDTKTNDIITYSKIGGPSLWDMIISPDGTRLYISTTDGDCVTVIDTATNSYISLISVKSYPIGLAETVESSKLYIAYDHGVEVVDTKTNAVIKTISSGPSMYLEMKGTLLYVNNGFIIDTTTDTIVFNPNSITPLIFWDNPGDIIYGTALNSIQLNAAALYHGNEVPGTFAYTPSSGTILSAGTHTLQAAFTPTDNINYKTATASVQINVLTPVQKIQQMTTSIQGLVTSGQLKKGQAAVLKATLGAAKVSLNAGKMKVARVELNTFIAEVKVYVKKGILSSQNGQALIDGSNAIINAIN